MNNELVPLCLYKSANSSYIGLPQKKYKNGIKTYVCDKQIGIEYQATIWVVNPDFRPIPTGMSLFCAQKSYLTTIKLEPVYDPFDIEENCIRFITWVQPIPYTSPLYIYSSNSNYYISFKKDPPPEFKEVNYSPIYVLDKGSDFKVVNGIPQYLFSPFEGKCIPDPNGINFGECVVLYNKNLKNPELAHKQSTLLNYLGYRYGKKDNNVCNYLIYIITFILLVIILIIAII